jgi:hypothetical protein
MSESNKVEQVLETAISGVGISLNSRLRSGWSTLGFGRSAPATKPERIERTETYDFIDV